MNRWRLRTKLGLYVGLNGNVEPVFTANEGEALVFDGRDNPAIKVPFYQTILGQPLEVEACAS